MDHPLRKKTILELNLVYGLTTVKINILSNSQRITEPNESRPESGGKER
jgi:hypothetical protein